MAFGRTKATNVPAEWAKRRAASDRRAQKQAATIEKQAATIATLTATLQKQAATIEKQAATIATLTATLQKLSRTVDGLTAAVDTRSAAVDRVMTDAGAARAALDERLTERLRNLDSERRAGTARTDAMVAEQAAHAANADARHQVVASEIGAALTRLDDAREDLRRQHDQQAQLLADRLDQERRDRTEDCLLYTSDAADE